MKNSAILGIILVSLVSSNISFGQNDTRAGTCSDAKQQFQYFCIDRKGDPNDIMTQAELACNNAKRHVAAACDGEDMEDFPYSFKEGTPDTSQ